VWELDAEELQNPETPIAEIMLAQLSETCAASIKFDALLEAVAALAQRRPRLAPRQTETS
jgi:hypothetical protein